jgi:hypothetical protein
MLYLLNADRAGADSVAPFIRSGKIVHLPCPTYVDFDKHIAELVNKGGNPEDDVIILDTISRLADTTRDDMTLGMEGNEQLWDKKDLYLKNKEYLGVYRAAGSFILRRLRNAAAVGYRIVCVAHEFAQVDEDTYTKVKTAQVNPALYKTLIATSSDVMRLSIAREDVVDDAGRIVVRAGARCLQTTSDDTAECKYQVEPDDEGNFPVVPKFIPDPNMRRVFRVLKKKPTFLTIFGAPGAGKTTLACSEAFTIKAEKKEKAVA